MKDVVLKELAAKWMRNGRPPEVVDGGPDTSISNAIGSGMRLAMGGCASDLLKIIELLGDEE